MRDTDSGSNGNKRMRYLTELDKSALPPDGGPSFNRLIFSRSPYLLQHAGNPVDWFPWGDEAFEKARAEDKPVFLSIGYATCHWCHVMEQESFEDPEVAAVLNEKFVSIKLDREERPDIDDQYMSVAQLMTGGGGWPLSIFMASDRRPFYAATYLPKTTKMGMTGFLEVLRRIDEVWRTDRSSLFENCALVMQSLEETAAPAAGQLQDDQIEKQAFGILYNSFDRQWGGMGEAPKFPLPGNVSFLLRYWKKTGTGQALVMADQTLSMIRKGGIFDQLGYGLHRYSVDKRWLVPHFEKMLYDQAMMALTCLEAFQATGDRRFSAIAEDIFTFVRDEMTSSEGGFYSAWDADTEGGEGAFYTWTRDEILNALGEEEGKIFCRLFGVTEQGTFEGRNILHLAGTIDEFASGEGLEPEGFRIKVESWRRTLLALRARRTRPLRDEKVLTSWNGLMIAALARGFAVTGVDEYRESAEKAADFVLTRLRTQEGRLLRSYYGGESTIPAFLEDYSFFVWGLIELYEATLQPHHLEEAQGLTRKMIRLFIDEESYGFFDTASDVRDVLVRKKGRHDGVIPSGNAVAAMNLLKLGRILSDQRLLDEGKGVLRAFMGSVAENPLAGLRFLAAAEYLREPELEVTLAGRLDSPETGEMLRAVRRRYLPGLVLRHTDGDGDGPTSARICTTGRCRLPVTGVRDLEGLLDEIA